MTTAEIESAPSVYGFPGQMLGTYLAGLVTKGEPSSLTHKETAKPQPAVTPREWPQWSVGIPQTSPHHRPSRQPTHTAPLVTNRRRRPGPERPQVTRPGLPGSLALTHEVPTGTQVVSRTMPRAARPS
ncbi:hypothetical protein [Kibdelosporangium philippinense]|uniref:hypothetical protein n=1 Tax=Kibdelosporangium philippinense TaxID=211113 RepID=UPI0036100E16